jgi:hypothetical protein
MKNNRNLYIILVTGLLFSGIFAQASFQIPITITNGTVSIVNKLGVNSGNSIGVDTASALGGYRELLAPPPPPPPYDLDSRFVTIPGRVTTYPIGLGGGIFNDFRNYTAPDQIDTFKIKIDGDGTENNTTFVTWPSNLSTFGDTWTIKPQTGTSWPTTNMLGQTSLEIPAGASKNILIIKVGAKGVTDINAENSSTPENFSLIQNYPNPFNPSTTVRYTIPYESKVKLTVYNSLGELVEVLVDNVVNAGNYSINFNAKNLSSGIYLIKIDAVGISQLKTFTQTIKSLLLK